MKERLSTGEEDCLKEKFEAINDLRELYKEIEELYMDLVIDFDGKRMTFKEFLIWLQRDNNITNKEKIDHIRTLVKKFESNLRLKNNEIIQYRLCAFIAIWISVLEEDNNFKLF